MSKSAYLEEIDRIVKTEHTDPYCLLGIHPAESEVQGKKAFVIRTFQPNAADIKVLDTHSQKSYTMTRVHEGGFFETLIDDKDDFFPYQFKITGMDGHTWSIDDPYCFLPVLTDFDLYLFNEGTHHKIYEKLGSHKMTLNDIEGTLFCVWAPCAKRVSVVGQFNQWDGRRHQMRCRGNSGVWEIFIPGVAVGDYYKYEIKTPSNELYVKSDPYALYSELRPGTASIVYDLDRYQWQDETWMKERAASDTFEKPVSIYEVHLGSWATIPVEGEEDRFLTYIELADRLVSYVKDMGYTHIELLPVAEHPFDGSWGYQVTGYYAITSRYGSPEDFMYFVDTCHQNGIGVLVDWVPAHFPKDGHGLARFDGTAIYEHADARQGEHLEWGTHIFNYSRHEVRNFLISNAVFLFEKYHIDGLRVDAVASTLYLDFAKKPDEWLPNKWGGNENIDAVDFLRQLNAAVYQYFPGIMMIAEESTSWPLVTKPPYMGGLGFSYKWNMGWMNDYLKYISLDPIFRKYNQDKITFSIMYAMSENFMLVLSHDEVVHGKCSMLSKMPGDYWQKFAGLRTSYGYMYGHPGKKLLFMGGEFGQFIEWDYKKSLDWHLLGYEMHKKLQTYVKDLNHLYRNEPAMYEIDFSYDGFEWIDCNDTDHSVVSFIRKAKDWRDSLIFICNFTPEVRDHYRIGVPFDTFYKEILNSDAAIYGGSNVGNLGEKKAEAIPFHSKPYSLNLTLPPLGTLVLKPQFSVSVLKEALDQ